MKVKKDYMWYGITAFLAALVVVVYLQPGHIMPGQITPAKAGELVKNLYSSAYNGMNFTIENVTDKAGIYEVTLKVEFNGRTQTLTSGITKDGKYFMPTVVDVEKLKEQLGNAQQTQQQQKFEPKKTAKPDVKLFVMPFCPFGQPAENAMYSVAKLFGNKISYRIHYIITLKTASEWNQYLDNAKKYFESKGLSADQINSYINRINNSAIVLKNGNQTYYMSSLHGKNEAMEVIRQLCIWKYYPNKALDYIWNLNHNCTLDNVNTCWIGVASKLGIDTNKINTCYNNEGVTLALQEQKIDNEYGASASPTLIINGVTWNGERTSNAYKNAICQSFTTEPAECNQTVNETATAPKGSCGQ